MDKTSRDELVGSTTAWLAHARVVSITLHGSVFGLAHLSRLMLPHSTASEVIHRLGKYGLWHYFFPPSDVPRQGQCSSPVLPPGGTVALSRTL